jgi:hypothetical protein
VPSLLVPVVFADAVVDQVEAFRLAISANEDILGLDIAMDNRSR